MSFKRPFRAPPVRPAGVWQQRQRNKRRSTTLRRSLVFGLVSLSVFGTGMFVTHPTLLSSGLSVLAPLPVTGEPCRFVSVRDGDTIRCDGERVRLADIDGPEVPGSPKYVGGRA